MAASRTVWRLGVRDSHLSRRSGDPKPGGRIFRKCNRCLRSGFRVLIYGKYRPRGTVTAKDALLFFKVPPRARDLCSR